VACVQVHVVVATPEIAATLVRSLLDERLIACGQVLGPMTSRYRWHGELEEAEEWLVVCKTTDAKAAQVTAVAARASGAEVPEVLVTPVIGGFEPYLAWVEGEVGD
jgi:periplasmic divalent cation tolerance protein